MGGIIPILVPIYGSNNIRLMHNIVEKFKDVYLISDNSDIATYLKLNYITLYNVLIIDDYIVNNFELDYKISRPDYKDTVFVQFSSGSTNQPKGIALNYNNLLTNINGIEKKLKIDENDSCLNWLPLTYNIGLIGFHIMPLILNKNQYLMETRLFQKNPLLWIDKANEYRATILASPNFGYKHFIDYFIFDEKEKKWDLSNIKAILNGGEPISIRLMKSFVKNLSKYKLNENCILPVYGMAEATLAVTMPNLKENL